MSSKAGRKSPPQKQSSQKQKQPQQSQQAQNRAEVPAKPYPPRPQTAAATSTTQQARRPSHEERQAAARAAAARRRRMASIRRIGIFAALALVLAGVVAALIAQEASRPGESVPMMVSNHIEYNPGSPPAYNSDPPTSGPHVQSVPQFKVYTEPMTKELQVHGLEDGGVIIHYKTGLDQATVDRLASLASLYIEQPRPKNHVILVPDPNLSHPIVLTTWRRIDRLDAFDEARIRRFIDTYVGIDHHGESGS
ncbi:MAG TPA: DUF3105 domain-containing protein [Chloroflexia bacterium]|nr:DUF3105 domain-containing protein [Chloroflexia bacterium]